MIMISNSNFFLLSEIKIDLSYSEITVRVKNNRMAFLENLNSFHELRSTVHNDNDLFLFSGSIRNNSIISDGCNIISIT